MDIEKSFLYTDLNCNEVILVKPPLERYTWRKTSAQLEQIIKQLSNSVSPPETRFTRVVFGLAMPIAGKYYMHPRKIVG